MDDSFHQLANVTTVGNADALTIPHARSLLDAVERNRDYTLLEIQRHPADGLATSECLIVEVECDGVPPKSPVDIRYRERLALVVPNDPKRLIEVLALRRDFPILIHQNQGLRGGPPSLCLYFEPPAAVLRTWTPQMFLRRIQWWLEKSARNELHPADQPIEHLFFASKYEMVLPWNLADLHKDPTQRFRVTLQQVRPDLGFTCFLEPISNGMPNAKTVTHIELMLPSIVHGFVERDPVTLGELSDLLAQRGVDFIASLREQLRGSVGENGATTSENDTATIILLHVPIRRNSDVEPDGITHRAFVVPVAALELGVATGALFVLEKRYYNDVLNTHPSNLWRDQAVLPMGVLIKNDAAAARRQSGILDEGPAGILIGAGSLGSAMLNLWGRGGWGRWTVIDNDHIKPHNLSKHTAYAQHIGELKSTVVTDLQAAAMEGAVQFVPIVADATDLAQESVAQALSVANLVIDASTTLEYPRATSSADALPRHFSAFVTPDGNAAILLAEDADRKLRLRTLEAQYYRALIQEEWGSTHLKDQVSTFWSGTSCRDISTVLPYSRILGHASCLAEQIQAASTCDAALIRVWQRDPSRGGVHAYDVPVLPEQRFPLEEFDVFIDGGVEQQLRNLRRQEFPNETGGVLLGYYDFNVKAVVIVVGLPAPPDSKSSEDSFERGVVGLAEAVKDANTRTGGMVSYIGEWHSHPPGHSASPSSHDFTQLLHLALGMADDGLPAIQLIVGEQDLQVLKGEVK